LLLRLNRLDPQIKMGQGIVRDCVGRLPTNWCEAKFTVLAFEGEIILWYADGGAP